MLTTSMNTCNMSLPDHHTRQLKLMGFVHIAISITKPIWDYNLTSTGHLRISRFSNIFL